MPTASLSFLESWFEPRHCREKTAILEDSILNIFEFALIFCLAIDSIRVCCISSFTFRFVVVKFCCSIKAAWILVTRRWIPKHNVNKVQHHLYTSCAMIRINCCQGMQIEARYTWYLPLVQAIYNNINLAAICVFESRQMAIDKQGWPYSPLSF